MTLAKYIGDLLYRYECVIVPKFGGFVTNEISAKVNHFTHTFYAPSKQITFNSHLQNSDGLLVNYVASAKSISYAKANEFIENEVDSERLILRSMGWQNKVQAYVQLCLNKINLKWENNTNKTVESGKMKPSQKFQMAETYAFFTDSGDETIRELVTKYPQLNQLTATEARQNKYKIDLGLK